MRAQHEVRVDRLDEEGVLHRARGVVVVEVERVEVEPLVLELGAFGDLPAHADEDVAHLLHEQGQRMPGALHVASGDGRDIDRFGRELGLLFSDGQLGLARGEAPLTRPRACPTSLPVAAFGRRAPRSSAGR